MDKDFISNEETDDIKEDNKALPATHYKIPDANDASIKHQLSGMFLNWFLDYSSYVILNRSIPYLLDGFKPVQRRILHSMRRMEDGRYNKVANIVGHTMQFHPHGDASIYEALVQLGQKKLLVDCQGNWGNVLTGDSAAAGRYIEARLSKFAMEVVFNPKTTDWQLSYDGRNKEPIVLPVKFPLLLAQGADGIGVGLTTKILPHNFNELADAAISYLKGENFILYPDFQTGGYIDVSKYNDGKRDGKIRIRAKIGKLDNKTLCISEIPYGTTTESLIDSILKANEKGKIQIKKVENNTSANVEILVHIAPGRSSDKTIDALYAFTQCQVSISPVCCVIYNDKPEFMGVSDVLKFSTDNTVRLLKEELLIRKVELQESIFFLSLEKIFISERMYKDPEFENAGSTDEAIDHIAMRMAAFKDRLFREIEREDLVKLLAIEMRRILKFNADKADRDIAAMQKEMQDVQYNLDHIIDFTIKWFEHLKEKYGAAFPRLTEIRNFDNIEAVKVVDANEKLYINRADGFIGTSLKRDEFVCNCSDIDDVIIFYKDGKFKVVKVGEKIYVGKNIIHLAVFKKNDTRTIYNMVYRNGNGGASYMKRFYVNGISRDKEYDLTQGEPGTKVLYFSANPNGEAETIKVFLKPRPRVKSNIMERDFQTLAIKGRSSMGNLLTKFDVLKITLKHKGASTLGGRKVWFDFDILRLNYDGRGEYLGEFMGEDKLVYITKNGQCALSDFSLENHYPDDLMLIEKYDPEKTWTLALFDADQGFAYLKRFNIENSNKTVSLPGDNPASKLLFLTGTPHARLQVSFAGENANKGPVVIDCDEFIGVKSYKAKGKRISTFDVDGIEELEPAYVDEEPAEDNGASDNADEAGTVPGNNTENPDGEIHQNENGEFSLF